MAPFHPVGQNPTLAMERDLELIQHLDRLGFDEAWVGEHHSAGYEIIASPEVFIGIAAERTKHIKLGTGVSSLPYHHPLMLADRMVLLDHLTRGRTMLGVGPGQLTSDAHMLGIPADAQRPRMEESLDAIMALLRGETVTMETDGFILQRRAPAAHAVQRPVLRHRRRRVVLAHGRTGRGQARHRHAVGRRDREAGHGPARPPLEPLGGDRARARARRRPVEVAPRRPDAPRGDAGAGREGGRVRHRAVLEVLHARAARPGRCRATRRRRSSRTTRRPGSRSSARRTTRSPSSTSSIESSNGGFGAFLLFGHDWATPAATLRSAELFAQYVMPKFQGQLDAPAASCDWVTGSGGEFVGRAANAIAKAIEDHAKERVLELTLVARARWGRRRRRGAPATGEPWWSTIRQRPSSCTNTFVAATRPPCSSATSSPPSRELPDCRMFSSHVTHAVAPDDVHDLVGEHELDERGVGEDRVPRSRDARPAVQRRPAGVRDRAAVGPVPDLGHHVEVPGLERGVVRRVRRGDGGFALGHGCHDGAPCLSPRPPRIAFPSTSGVTLAVHDWGGDGDPVLLAHPTGFHGRAWAPVAAKLVERGRRVWSFDFRGHGDSDRVPRRHLLVGGVRPGRTRRRPPPRRSPAIPRLLAAGHSKGGASLLSGVRRRARRRTRASGRYEPIIIPVDAPILAGAGQPAVAGRAPAARPVAVARRGARFLLVEAAAERARARTRCEAYVEYGLRDRDDGTVELKCRPEDEATMYMMGASLGLYPQLGEVTVPVLVGSGADTTSITPEMAEPDRIATSERLTRGLEGSRATSARSRTPSSRRRRCCASPTRPRPSSRVVTPPARRRAGIGHRRRGSRPGRRGCRARRP